MARQLTGSQPHREPVAPGQDDAAEEGHWFSTETDKGHQGDVGEKYGRGILPEFGILNASSSPAGD